MQPSFLSLLHVCPVLEVDVAKINTKYNIVPASNGLKSSEGHM